MTVKRMDHDTLASQSAVVGASSGRGEAPPPDQGPPARFRLDLLADPPDLIVDVTDPLNDSQHLRCRVYSPHLGKKPASRRWPLPQRAPDFVAELMREFVSPDADADGRLLSLTGAGLELWSAAPEEFKRAFWRLVDEGQPLRSILVASEEPSVPWELMVPHRQKNDGTREQRQPLGVEFAIGRSIAVDHVAPDQALPLTDSFVIAPNYPGSKPKPLKFAASEAAFVTQVFTGNQISPVDIRNLNATLTASRRSLLHFVCHGAAGAAGTQSIYLDGVNKTLTSRQTAAMMGMQAACSNGRPLVFLNACEVGRPIPTLAGAGGFARTFIDLGARAVVAPLWSVKDSIAHQVAQEFYTEIQKNRRKPFAQILSDIRARAYQSGEDTYAAYCFYGDPMASAG